MIEQHITTWEGWPDDVREKLQKWNQGFLLSFVRGPDFTCERCRREIKAHPNGDVHLRASKKSPGYVYCEECVIAVARKKKETPPGPYRVSNVYHVQTLTKTIDRLERKVAKMKRQAKLERDFVEILEGEIPQERLSAIKAELRGKFRRRKGV